MDYQDTYQKWLQAENLDPKMKQELQEMDETAIKDAFHANLEFGTSGLRGIMGPGTNRINIYTIRKATIGFGQYLINTNQLKGVAIAYDNRAFSREFAFEAANVLASLGISSYVYDALRPTPMLSFAVMELNLSGGIIITASHNPKEYNGYKVYHASGRPLNLDEASIVLDLMNQVEDVFEIEFKNPHLVHVIPASFDDTYLERVKTLKVNDTKKKIKILYSPLHGAGGTVIPKLLNEEGYDLVCYEPQMIHDPNFSNTPSSNPEEKKAYDLLIAYAQEINADMIMITDPDADRLGIAVKHEGVYHLINGNQTASLELYYLLTHKTYENGHVFSTNVTTPLIKKITEHFNYTYIETLTGFKFIAEAAQAIKKQNGTFIFGCEESYGSLIGDFVYDKDAVQACYLLAEIASYLHDRNKTIVDYLNEIGLRFGYFVEVTRNISFPGILGMEEMKNIMEHYKSESLMLDNRFLIAIDNLFDQTRIQDGEINKINLPKASVLKYYYEEGLQIVLRPSGTEPKLKIYFSIQSSTFHQANKVLDCIIQEVMTQIESVNKNHE